MTIVEGSNTLSTIVCTYECHVMHNVIGNMCSIHLVQYNVQVIKRLMFYACAPAHSSSCSMPVPVVMVLR